MDTACARRALSSAPNDQFAAAMIQVLKSHRHRGNWLTIGQMSQLAGRSVRSLQRRLADEDSVFSEMVQSARQELATELLADSKLSVSEIATRLGYSKAANFSRAFQRWTGKSPTELRREG